MKGAPFRLACEQALKWSLCTGPPPLLRFLLRGGGRGVCTQASQVERGDKQNRRGLGDKKRL